MALSPAEDQNRRLLRARDAMDRDYAQRLDLPALARLAHMSQGHFSRTFRTTFGETPHHYLQRRRIERAMALLRDPASSVTEAGLRVGFESLGAFSRAFKAVTGVAPSRYRAQRRTAHAPACFVKAWLRPVSFGEAKGPATHVR
ncbi:MULTISPECIES: helix-turn-helix domain-containing protein [Dactylosporangium]|uniref:Transcriptional regulator n=2 Tax=Dactylosporangium TaxID=35753 RepID=A0A9W6KK12_9ACTN|nr:MULTISPECIES: AraC family transcriptional regulator [Dactylosporangium]UAB99374.1 helix-turn-helix transcriptional regulator [Dactylosporangium vinaceum]UWZ47601.1 helix-turn-helix transcriptional regulator [Dactylosporangium matsuzakiense]GLL01565.1 transcriptional regulator [Dactylosporangium matsuzakiense]